jgi:zinc transport system substrate-binding protein
VGTIAKPKVYVTNYALKYFAHRIGANSIQVVYPIPADLNPIFWMPDSDTIVDMQNADLIILNGASFEKWISFVSLPHSKLVDTSKGFDSDYIRVENTITHSHGSQGKHTHRDIHYTTWLDFNLAVRQAQAIEKVLSVLIPERKAFFKTNYQALAGELFHLDRLAAAGKDKIAGKPLLASHPFMEYFARRYSLNLKSLHWYHGSVPHPGQWKELNKTLEVHPSKWMIWEAKPVRALIAKLKAVGIGSIVFNPCYSKSPDGDFIITMKRNIENLISNVQSQQSTNPNPKILWSAMPPFDSNNDVQ